uniref:Uncharacterized protein n=2 Tax=Bactrocera latifrons TaxID=174628 RepID=A0A0K8VGR1_BACLA
MNPQNITFQLPGNENFSNNLSDSNYSGVLKVDAVSFEAFSERILNDNSDNISETGINKMDITERERDRKRKRYLTEEDHSRITRNKLQQQHQLQHEQELTEKLQIEAQSRLVCMTDEGDKTTVFSKDLHLSEFISSNYDSSNIEGSSPYSKEVEAHAKKLLRSSITGLKQATVTKVSKRSYALERKRLKQDEDASYRDQSKRALINKYRKRMAQKVVKKSDITSSNCCENDAHNEHADGCENGLFNSDNSNSREKLEGEDMLGDQLGKQRLDTDTSSVLDYNNFGILNDNNSLKMRETSTNSPTQYTAGMFYNEKECTDSNRFHSNQYYVHNETRTDGATTKTTSSNPRTWEENVPFNPDMQLSKHQELHQPKQQNCNLHEFNEADRKPVAPYSTCIDSTQANGLAQRVHRYRYDSMNTTRDGNERSATKTSPNVNSDVDLKQYGTAVSCWQHSNTNGNVINSENSANNIDNNDKGCASESPVREKIKNYNKEQTYVSSQLHCIKDHNSQQSMYTQERSGDSNSPQLAGVVPTSTNIKGMSNCNTSPNLNETTHSTQSPRSHNKNVDDVYDEVDSTSTNAKTSKDSNYVDQHDVAYIEKAGVNRYALSLGETSKTKSSALITISTTATNVNDISDTTTCTTSTTTTATTTTTSISTTTTTKGCVTTNVTINKIPNSRVIKSDSSEVITTPVATVNAASTVDNCENGKHMAQVPSTNIVNDNVLGESTYNLNNSQELGETLSASATAYAPPHSNTSQNLDNRNEPWNPTPNEPYQRYNNSNHFCQSTVDGGSEACLSATAELCYKISDDTNEKPLKDQHQQHAVSKENVIDFNNKEHQMHYSKKQHGNEYITRQTIDASVSLIATNIYNTELQLQQQRQGSQDIQHYMQEELCQQMQHQQRHQLQDHQQQEELNRHHHHHHQQHYPHDASQVVQQSSLHDYNLHSHPQQLHPLHDALSHSHQQIQHFEQQHQLGQRHDEEQQQHLIAYLHHTTEQTRLQEQLQHHEYQQHQQQFHQEQQHLHNQHQQQQQQMQTNFLLITKKQQHPQPHISMDLKRINRPPPTSIDDLIIDEFSEDPHATYKLGLSPNHVKHENQDDGYETSAGDVLTPNSHSSSTHSVTPQHQIQHGINIIPQRKYEEQQMKIQQPLQSTTAGDVKKPTTTIAAE